MAARVNPDSASPNPRRDPTKQRPPIADLDLGVYPPVAPILQARRGRPQQPTRPPQRPVTPRPAPQPPELGPRPVPHSRRVARRADRVVWPPPGWGEQGLAIHFEETDRALAMIKAIFDPTRTQSTIDVAEARAKELAQLGKHAAEKLAEATTAVLEMRSFATASTHELDVSSVRGHRGTCEPEEGAC